MDKKNPSRTNGSEFLPTNEAATFSTDLKSKINNHLSPERLEEFWTLADSLRDQWGDCKGKAAAFKASRDKLAMTLCEIRTLLAPQGLFNKLLDETGMKRRTAYDMMEDYGRVRNLPEAVRKEAAKQHLDLTAKRLAPKLESIKEKLQAARTQELAAPLVSELKEHKRKSSSREIQLPEVREIRRKAVVAQARAFLEGLKMPQTEFRLQMHGLLYDIISGFGFTLILSESTNKTEAV
jgi:hypothetical protein